MRLLLPSPRAFLPWLLALGCELVLAEATAPVANGADRPDFAAFHDVGERKRAFFEFLAPLIEEVNDHIEAERAWLLGMRDHLATGGEVLPWQQPLLRRLGQVYDIDASPGSPAYFRAVERRVDTLPASLVMAQAANESGWGTSRFAVEGNNFFGQWCFADGCGLVPEGRPEGETYEVKLFESVADSVAAYFRNVNSFSAYRELRNIRAEYRYLGLALDGRDLAWGLESYSTRGEAYIRELIRMIDHNQLGRFDRPAFYARD